jgi:hypothetical protein
MKKKAIIIKATGQYKKGDSWEGSSEEFDVLISEGVAVTETEWTAIKALRTTQEGQIVKAIDAGVTRKAIVPKGDAANSVDTVKAAALKQLDNGADLDFILGYIEGLRAATPAPTELETRLTAALPDDGHRRDLIVGGEPTLVTTLQEYLKASEPWVAKRKDGGVLRHVNKDEKGIKDLVAASKMRASVMTRLADMVGRGADFQFNDTTIRALAAAGTDYPDSAGQLGVLNTGLTLQWTLGHLENQLPMIDDITTDVSGTPVLFEQFARTRYIKVPGVQLKTAAAAWTGTTGNDVDVNVQMSNYAGVPISINNMLLAATARQLMQEQKAPQLYGLGEYIIYTLVNCIINGSTRINNAASASSTITFNPNYTSPTLGGTAFNVAGATLRTFTSDLPEAMDEAKFPGGDEPPGSTDLQRFAWVHGRIYAALTADTNFMLNQSIWGSVAKTGGNVLETGRFDRVGNTKFRKSQLMTDQISTTGSGADGAANAMFVNAGTFANAGVVGMAGTRSSLLFVSRVPTDYTKVLPEIPSTAAIEIVTGPLTGISYMIVKYLDHAYETANMRAQLMWGVGIGDERQGMLLRVK